MALPEVSPAEAFAGAEPARRPAAIGPAWPRFGPATSAAGLARSASDPGRSLRIEQPGQMRPAVPAAAVVEQLVDEALSLQFGDVEEQGKFREYLTAPRSWNRYAYARGNPLHYVDPDGAEAVAAT